MTPNDNSNLPFLPRCIYVGVTGNITAVSMHGETATFIALAVGYHPLRPTRINSTGTTATGILGLY